MLAQDLQQVGSIPSSWTVYDEVSLDKILILKYPMMQVLKFTMA